MFWIIAFLITLLGSAAQLLLGHQPLTLVHSADVLLRWIVIFFYGVITLVAGLQHVLNPDRIAQYIGWPAGSGFQHRAGTRGILVGEPARRADAPIHAADRPATPADLHIHGDA